MSCATYCVKALITTRMAGQRVRACINGVRLPRQSVTISAHNSFQVKWLTLETVCQIGFGKGLELLERPKNRFIIDLLHAFSLMLGVYIQFIMLQSLRLEKILELGQMVQGGRQDWHVWGRKFEDSILAADHTTQSSLFSKILDSKDPQVQESFPVSDLRAEGIFLMLAGKI